VWLSMSIVFSEGFPKAPTTRALFRMEGPDARDFLHRLTTSDARNLEPGQAVPACFLNAQGKIDSYFNLACEGPSLFWLDVECTDGKMEAARLREVIDRYTFAENFQLTEVTDLAHGLRQIQQSGFRKQGQVLVIPAQGMESVWGPGQELEQIEKSEGLAQRDTLDRFRVDHLLPAVGHEVTSEASPLEIGLAGAVASNKGCYPGQEVIEKVISLGSPARRLIRIEGQGTARPGDILQDGASTVGQLTTVTRQSDTFRALAIVRKTHAKEGTELTIAAKDLPQEKQTHGRITAVAPYQAP
jgi:folate-binding protein YgfZ